MNQGGKPMSGVDPSQGPDTRMAAPNQQVGLMQQRPMNPVMVSGQQQRWEPPPGYHETNPSVQQQQMGAAQAQQQQAQQSSQHQMAHPGGQLGQMGHGPQQPMGQPGQIGQPQAPYPLGTPRAGNMTPGVQQLIYTLSNATSPTQQMQVLSILRSSPHLMAAFLRFKGYHEQPYPSDQQGGAGQQGMTSPQVGVASNQWGQPQQQPQRQQQQQWEAFQQAPMTPNRQQQQRQTSAGPGTQVMYLQQGYPGQNQQMGGSPMGAPVINSPPPDLFTRSPQQSPWGAYVGAMSNLAGGGPDDSIVGLGHMNRGGLDMRGSMDDAMQ